MIFRIALKSLGKLLWKSSVPLSNWGKHLIRYSHVSKYEWVPINVGVPSKYYVFEDANSDQVKQLHTGNYERFLFDAAAALQIEWHKKVIWDIGAHFGYLTLKFASLVDDAGKVFAFEPNPYNLERLNLHLSHNPMLAQRISVQGIALSDSEDEQPFKYSKNINESDLGFLISTGTPSDRISSLTYGRFLETIVAVKTVDGFVAANPRAIPNIIKIDVEGAECTVLKGATQVLHEHQPILFVEIHNVQSMYCVLNLLHKMNYSTHLLDDPYGLSSKAFIIAQRS